MRPSCSSKVSRLATEILLTLLTLTPIFGASGTVLKPNGQPAANVSVYFVADHETLSVEHIGNSADPPKFTGVEAKTDGEGKFSISNAPSPCTIVVFDLAGYLEERHTAPEAGLELKLRGLGPLNGKLLTGSSPGSSERIEANNRASR